MVILQSGQRMGDIVRSRMGTPIRRYDPMHAGKAEDEGGLSATLFGRSGSNTYRRRLTKGEEESHEAAIFGQTSVHAKLSGVAPKAPERRVAADTRENVEHLVSDKVPREKGMSWRERVALKRSAGSVT